MITVHGCPTESQFNFFGLVKNSLKTDYEPIYNILSRFLGKLRLESAN